MRRRNEEAVVKEVISFVGADPSLYKHRKMRPGMQVTAHTGGCYPRVTSMSRSLLS